MTKKKLIPDVSEILGQLDGKLKFGIRNPKEVKENNVDKIEESEKKLQESMFRDFNTLTLGDYIAAAHIYNREMMGSKPDATQEMAYFTLFAFEERAKRLMDHYTYIH